MCLDFFWVYGTKRLDRFILQKMQQKRLILGREFIDLIKQNGSVVGHLQKA